MEGKEKAFGDAVGVVVREDAEVGVDLRWILGGKYIGEFLRYTIKRGVGDVAPLGFELLYICTPKPRALFNCTFECAVGIEENRAPEFCGGAVGFLFYCFGKVDHKVCLFMCFCKKNTVCDR